MKKALFYLVIGLGIIASHGCSNDDDDNVIAPLADLYGTWETNQVPVSGLGIFPGTATIQFNENMTYRSDVMFTDAVSGCTAELFWEGMITGNNMTINVTPTYGENGVSGCTDNLLNYETTAYSQNQIESAASIIDWIVNGDTLELIHGDGLERIYQRQN